MSKTFENQIKLFLFTIAIFMYTGLTASWSQITSSEEITTPTKKITYGILINTQGRNYMDASASAELMKTIRMAGFDFLIPQVREYGTVYYISVIEPRSEKIAVDFLDPLSELITLSHFPSPATEKILQIYPWLDILKVHNGKIQLFPTPESVAVKHPEWLSLTYGGKNTDESRCLYLDPALPEVGIYLEGLIKEVVGKYNIEGIYLDSISYPANIWGYNPEVIKLFKQETGSQETPSPDNPEWSEWRRAKLSTLLRRLSAAAKSVKPEIKVIAAVEVEGQAPGSEEEFKLSPVYSERLQDWLSWAKEGIVDVICLKNYWRDYSEAEKFKGWLRFINQMNSKSAFWVAVSGKLNFTDDIIGQMREAQTYQPDAIVLDNYYQPSRDNKDLLFSSLKRTVFIQPKPIIPTFVPPELRPTETPATPAITTTPVPSAPLTSPTVHTIPLETVTPSLPTTPVVTTVTTPIAEITTSPVVVATPILTPSPAPTPTPTPSVSLLISPTPVKWETIYLTNGNIIKGRIIDRINEQVIVETSDGLKLNLLESEIEKVEGE